MGMGKEVGGMWRRGKCNTVNVGCSGVLFVWHLFPNAYSVYISDSIVLLM